MPIFRQSAAAPQLVHFVLPPYEVPELIVMGGVVIENRGGAAANNIKIVLEYEDSQADKIRHLQVVSEAEYILRGGGDLQSFATLRVRKLQPGQRVYIYFSGPTVIQPRVTVTHYEG